MTARVSRFQDCLGGGGTSGSWENCLHGCARGHGAPSCEAHRGRAFGERAAPREKPLVAHTLLLLPRGSLTRDCGAVPTLQRCVLDLSTLKGALKRTYVYTYAPAFINAILLTMERRSVNGLPIM